MGKKHILMSRLQNRFDDFKSLDSLWSLLKEVFNAEEIKALLTDVDSSGNNALFHAFTNDPKTGSNLYRYNTKVSQKSSPGTFNDK
jgi:hypothetical protein